MSKTINNNTVKSAENEPEMDEYENFCKIREETIRQLYETSEELDKLARDVRISNIAGSAGGVVSSGLIVGGVIGAFFTLGASLVVTAVGAAIGVASAVTSVGASIVHSVISKNRQTEIDEALQKDNEVLERLFNMTEKFTLEADGSEQMQHAVHGAAVVGRATVVASDTTRVVVSVMQGAGRAVAIGGLVVSIVTLPLDIVSLVTNSIAIHENKPHQLAEHFREIAKKLTDNLRDEILPCLFDNTDFFLENNPMQY